MCKYNFFKNFIFSNFLVKDNEWISPFNSLYNGEIIKRGELEILFAQGFYGIFIALEYNSNKNAFTLNKINKFLSSIIEMLMKTNNIFLRCNYSYIYNNYYLNKQKFYETDKNGILGLVTALFMIFYYCNDNNVRDKVQYIAEKISNILIKYEYSLYNEDTKRYYSSNFQCIYHYYGINKALNYILGYKKKTLKLFLKGNIISIFKRKILVKYKLNFNLKIQKFLSKINIFSNLFKNEINNESTFNLDFYEFIIAGTLNRKNAIKIINILNHYNIKVIKNLNFAALYFYLCKKWKIKGKQENYYKNVLKIDEIILYPSKMIIPNSLCYDSYWNINPTLSWWHYDSMNNRSIDRTFNTNEFTSLFATYPPLKLNYKCLSDLYNTKNYNINIDIGLFYVMRYKLSNF